MSSPDIAVITNCGAEHLEGLDDLQGVCQENATIIRGLNPDGLLVVNGDDRQLLEAVRSYPGERITFGFSSGNDLFASDVICTLHGTEFSVNGCERRVFVPMLGRHTASNALAAIAVARKLCVPDEAIFAGLAGAHGPEMRLQLSQVGGVTLLNDAYNANPNSMTAALETLAALPTRGRRIAVLGEMRELGEQSEKYHREVGEYAAAKGKLDMLLCVGDGARWIAESAAQGIEVVYPFADSTLAAAQIPSLLHDGDLILLKASRGIRLEKVAAAIAGREAAARP
jgi:UDP-N-acetylmuramoyl-tripeptide--D-alanyl-D-alanine ligase